jgi:pimeloyl-ACP methyl ester carboxylesterase
MSKTVWRARRSNKQLEAFMRDVFYDKKQPIAPEFIDYFYELSAVSHMALFIGRLAHWSGMRRELYLQSDLPKIKQPVLIIWGKADPLMPYKSAQKNFHLIPGAKVIMLDNAGHMPPIETSQVVNDAIISFLKSE